MILEALEVLKMMKNDTLHRRSILTKLKQKCKNFLLKCEDPVLLSVKRNEDEFFMEKTKGQILPGHR